MKAIKWILVCMAVLYACCVAYALMPQKSVPVKELAGKDSRFIQVKDHTIHYIQAGQGKPLVLVHGFAGSTYTWRYLIPLLSQHYTVYALDLLGFGLSDKPLDADYNMSQQGQLVIDFIDAMKLPPVALVGHSMGGVIVSCAAVQAPQKIDRLIIMDAGFYHGGPPAFTKHLFFPFDVLMARSFYTKGTRSKSLLNSYYNKALITDELIENYLKPARTPHASDALARMMTKASGESYDGISSRISIPTLLIWARNDAPIPLSDGERLQREIKESKLVVVDKSGHMIQEEQPQQVAAAIESFLQ
jgi:pimeloyl-ACP methyl ester carboxylesterase